MRWPRGTLRSSAVALRADQLRMVDVIEAAFMGAGYSPNVGAAAVVNAYAESGLNPAAAGDNGKSIGLFQLNTVAGAGRGYTPAELTNPDRNAMILITRERAALAKVEAAAQGGAGIAALAGLFSRYVERPRDALGAAAHRTALTARLFPFGLRSEAAPASAGAPTGLIPATSARYWWVGGTLTALLLLGTVAYARARKRPTT